MIEARSCERFTRLLQVIDDPEVAHLLADLGPAERRHWQLFYRLAGRDIDDVYGWRIHAFIWLEAAAEIALVVWLLSAAYFDRGLRMSRSGRS